LSVWCGHNLRVDLSIRCSRYRNPFSSEADFNFVSCFVCNKVAKLQIDTYLAAGLGGTESRLFRSTYTMQQHLDVLDPFGDYLMWTQAEINASRHLTILYYRNVIDCVRYLTRQVLYRSDMLYEPILEYNCTGERLYSDMHMVDW